jgi:TetR/AcrR family acrAB operon transcriptional repressor
MDDSVRSDNTDRAGRILDAAARLIAHYGYDKTTMSDVAHEAGVSKGALYLHWDSKEALFEALFEREVWRYSADWLARLDADPDLWSYVGMFRHMMLTLQASPLMTALVRRDARVLGSFLRTDSRLLQVKLAANTAIFRLMQEAGAVRADIAPEALAYLLSLFAVGLVNSGELIAPADTPDLEQAMDALGRLLDRGLAPAEGSNKAAGRAIVMQVVAQMRAQQRGNAVGA